MLRATLEQFWPYSQKVLTSTVAYYELPKQGIDGDTDTDTKMSKSNLLQLTTFLIALF